MACSTRALRSPLGRVAFIGVPAEEYGDVACAWPANEGKLEFLGGKPELLRLAHLDDVDALRSPARGSLPRDRGRAGRRGQWAHHRPSHRLHRHGRPAQVMPILHPTSAVRAALAWGRLATSDASLVYRTNAKALASMVVDLLADGATVGREVVAKAKPADDAGTHSSPARHRPARSLRGLSEIGPNRSDVDRQAGARSGPRAERVDGEHGDKGGPSGTPWATRRLQEPAMDVPPYAAVAGKGAAPQRSGRAPRR